jgi:hypothetical protein
MVVPLSVPPEETISLPPEPSVVPLPRPPEEMKNPPPPGTNVWPATVVP